MIQKLSKILRIKRYKPNMFLVLTLTVISSLIACKKLGVFEANSSNASIQLENWFKSAATSFRGTLKFNSGNNKGFIGNGKLKSAIIGEGTWDFNQKIERRSTNLKWIEVPLNLGNGQLSLFENIKPSFTGLEADFTRVFLIIYTDERKKDTNYLVKLVSARLPIETKLRKELFSTKKVREIYYSPNGSIVGDYDLSENARQRFITSIPLTNNSGRVVEKKALTCTTTSTKYSECTVDANYNSVCTFYTTNLTRCVYNGDGDPNNPYNNNAFLEEGAEAGGGSYEFEDVQFQNQSFIDSLQGFPCAQGLLAALPSCDSMVSALFAQMFSFGGDISLTFKADMSLGKDSLVNGYTNNSKGGYDWFESQIHFNQWVLKNSTQEYILSTMFHESLHSMIDYNRIKYLNGVIDSATFYGTFPLFAQYNRALNNAEIIHHNTIANNYVNHVASLVKSFNPGISTEMANALAWKGLYGTTAWNMKTDTANILNLQRIARRDINDSSFSTYNLSICR